MSNEKPAQKDFYYWTNSFWFTDSRIKYALSFKEKCEFRFKKNGCAFHYLFWLVLIIGTQNAPQKSKWLNGKFSTFFCKTPAFQIVQQQKLRYFKCNNQTLWLCVCVFRSIWCIEIDRVYTTSTWNETKKKKKSAFEGVHFIFRCIQFYFFFSRSN